MVEIREYANAMIDRENDTVADLYFYGDIVSESWQSEMFEDDMCPKDVVKFLDQLDGVSTINVHINSGGGSVLAGLAIGNKLKQYQAQIIGYTDGIAASIAGVLLMFCDRVIMPINTMFMMHKPLSICQGNADDIRKEADILDQCQKVMLEVYMKKAKAGVTEETITEMINKETWLTGEEMQEYFDIEIPESLQVTAEIDVDALAARLAEKLASTYTCKDNMNLPTDQTPTDKPKDNTELEKLRTEILEDLDLI